jgi:PA14 domain/Bacterial Ig domain/CotH kinase protein/Chitobiase/beta-hexosaminidase C-terminal domain/Lamin Tail Domain/Immunoglobulin domain
MLIPRLILSALAFFALQPFARAFDPVFISEFLASNDVGLTDEDGDHSDWIEIYNSGATTVNLAGWRLTDESGVLDKWVFPSVDLAPKGFLLVFASNKDRSIAGTPLHTNFKLSSDGGYLALVKPDGSIAHEYNLYPAQYTDKPYGIQQTVSTIQLVGPAAPLKYFIPTSSIPDNATWTSLAFSDAAWANGANGIGFEATVSGWALKTFFSNQTIPSLSQAEAVIVTPSLQSSVASVNHPVVNFNNSASPGHYTTENPPPALNSGDVDHYVVESTGTITVPTAGIWTFCVSSDDGCSLQIRPIGGAYTTVLSFTGLRGMGDTIGTYNFPTAGDYEIRAIVFENEGGSGGEVSARFGSTTVWDSSFKLIGDTAAGGLAIKSVPIGTGGSGYTPYISTNVKASMYDAVPQKSSAYLRYSFSNPGGLTSLSMPIRYDDGFVAYLNGTEVARRNAPVGTPTNTSAATTDHPPLLAKTPETIAVPAALLQSGTNVLAIHGLNQAPGNGDFLIKTELSQYTVTLGSTPSYFQSATPAAFNTSAVYNKVAPVVANVQRGFYSTAQSVTLTCGTPSVVIRYTFDGSTPLEASGPSATYSGPITINKTTTLRYRAFKAGYDPSETVTQTYIFTSDVITQQPTGTPPTITNPTGATQPTTTWPGTFDSGTGKYQVNGQELDFGMDPDVVNNPTYSGTIQNDLKAIPTFSIVTDLPNLFDATTGIYVNPSGDTITWERPASLELIDPTGGKDEFQVNCGLRLRGGFSRNPSNPKHAFRIFFRDVYGPGKLKYPLFGNDPTGVDEFDKFDIRCSQNYSWAFQGDGGNGVLIRDEIARDMQLAMGEVSSHGALYHLYVNGQYWGVFNIDERPEASFGASYFGGDADDYDTIKVDPDIGYSIEATDGNMDAWTALWQLADTGLSAANTETTNNTTYQRMLGRNANGTPNPAYPVYLDPVNLIDEMLIVYWGGNLDAPISNFLSNQSPNNWFGVRDRTGAHGGFKFIQHDSEHTMLNVNEDRTGPWIAGSSASQGTSALSKSSPQYIFQQTIYAQEFKALFADRTYKQCFNNGVLTPARALQIFNARTAEMDRAVVGESARWGDSKVATPFTRSTWVAACDTVRSGFLPGRTAVLLSQLRAKGWYPSFDPAVFSQRGGVVVAGSTFTLTFAANTPAGSTIYYTTDGSDPRAFGGGVAPGAQTIASGGSIQVNASRAIRTRTKNGTTWSALDEASFYVQQDYSPLAITEVNYHPLPSFAGGNDGGDYEFIEFKNTGTSTLDLGGLTFTTGITFTFPLGAILPPGGFYLIVKNPAKFASRYPGITPDGTFSGGLDNAGEDLTLATATGGAVLTVDYDDDPLWPAAADGAGFTLVPTGTNYNSDTGTNWRASANINGSPKADDPAVNFAPIVINEVLTSSVPPLKDTIELFNPTGSPVNIGDWWLSDDRDTPKKYRIPSGTTIPANGYVVFDETQFNPMPGTGTSFALNGTGDDVYLYSGDAAGNLTGYSHGWSMAASEPDVSFGRYTNSIGENHFPRQISRTFASPFTNSGPLVGPLVINEIMYYPYTGYDEYIEIRNLTGAAVSLDGPSGTTWRIGGIGYNFPIGQNVPANGYALVVSIDPAVFRTKYAIPAQVPIFGPYVGNLQDNGERISLEQSDTPYLDPLGQTVIPYIVIDSVRYNDIAPWPIDAHGNGPALQRLNSSAYADDPINWFASGATPGSANSTNTSPTVTMTGPAQGATFTVPATVNFTANASDPGGSISKVEFYVDGGKVGEDSTSPYAFGWTAAGGIHTCHAVAIDNSLGTATSAPITIYVTTPVSQGLKAEYYNNRFLASPIAFMRIDSTINFTDAGGTWVNFGGVGTDNFSVRWSGQVRPPTSGTYTFYTMSDDGVRLFVNGQPLVNNWTDHGPTENTGNISLTANQLYTITMEFYENGGGATAQLSWSGPSVAKQIIPVSTLYPDSTPIVLTHPSNLTVEAGSNALFTVVASGLNNQYQWRKNGIAITGATGATLTIQQTIPSDAGTYSCLISNGGGFATSNGATLTVTFTDTDGDGMQNSWETFYGLNPNSAADATLDKDGDGETNKEEFLAGTNPSNPTDVLRPAISKVANGWKITFTAQSRKSYAVQYKNALTDPTWTTLQTVAEQFGVRTMEIVDTGAGDSRFYRVVTPSP